VGRSTWRAWRVSRSSASTISSSSESEFSNPALRAVATPAFCWRISSTPAGKASSAGSVSASVDPSSTTITFGGPPFWLSARSTDSSRKRPWLKQGITTVMSPWRDTGRNVAATPLFAALPLNPHAQKGRRDRGAVFGGVLFVEQGVQVGLEVSLAVVRRRRLECVHGWPVVVPERGDELRRRARVIEGEGVQIERDLLLRDPGSCEPPHNDVLHAPLPRADETGRGRRRVGGADLEDLGHQGGVVRDPVPHHDSATRLGDPHHLLGNVERLGGEHRPED